MRLERRKTDRREHNDTSHLRCESCGHMNESGYKFCGMCGTRIERRIAERRGTGAAARAANSSAGGVAVAPPRTAEFRMSESEVPAPDRQRTSDLPRRSDSSATLFRSGLDENRRPEPPEKSGIVGPSFLGLSDESSDDETSYLMEDESSSGSGLRKLVLLVILAAIAGLVFVQYRASLHAKLKSPAPAQPSPTVQQNQTLPPGAAPGSRNQAQPGPGAAAQPSPQNATPANSDPASTGATQDSQPPADASPPPKSESLLLPQMSPTDVAEKSNDPAADASPENKRASDAARKMFDAPVPVEQKPSPLLVRAQQFLHGQGVQQNCEQGLVYLRAAAQKNEPAAAVQMGALYASGRCVHQDRVMAYRWFNSAHELEPANQWIQKNMDLLWGQMSDQERRLAAY